MSDTALLFIALAIATLGMASLALTIDAHWRQLFGQRAQARITRILLRAVGAALVAGALGVCTAADPFMMAILVWPMLLMVGAGLVAGMLTVCARARKPDKAQKPPRDRGMMEVAE